jgi:hypothetical protein
MKFIIKESKLNKFVIDFLNNIIDLNELNYFHPYDTYEDDNGDYVKGKNPNVIDFYYGDYNEDDVIFRLYDKGYWTGQSIMGDKRRNESPILTFMNDNIPDNLNGMFGDNGEWHEGFKEWFRTNFNHNIKTIRD